MSNRTALDGLAAEDREQVLRHTLVSTHTILHVQEGAFVSLLDPPPGWKAHAEACQNVGTWPVLAGAEGSTDTILSSPIILYDYPQVAPESPGDLFDATEIDEVLTLRILTLTEDEKREMAADERTRRLLERTEALGRNQLLGLHGAVRGLRPLKQEEAMDPGEDWRNERPVPDYTRADGVKFRPGDRVRLRPRQGADAFDLLLAGKAAVIEVIEQDFEGGFHFAVTVDDDPGRDLGAQGRPGHRFFFRPDEVEPLAPDGESRP
ncbi:MAG: hypothetical protein HYS12_08615 [Planctomycetes bacterium]|nr:hypothetical protein [Planctomycetota bacterium]